MLRGTRMRISVMSVVVVLVLRGSSAYAGKTGEAYGIRSMSATS